VKKREQTTLGQDSVRTLVFNLGQSFFAESTSKLLLFATNGKFYSLDVAKLPGGRGHGYAPSSHTDLESARLAPAPCGPQHRHRERAACP